MRTLAVKAIVLVPYKFTLLSNCTPSILLFALVLVSVFVCAVEESDSGEMLSLPVSDAAHEPSKKTKADKRQMYLFFIISNYPFL